ncbi:MAG: hypothetical protein N2319_09680 [Candidatus Kapabacteria bacterium]|nr:hypothetical protein [Candidatus Kapabacteria bacterium]
MLKSHLKRLIIFPIAFFLMFNFTASAQPNPKAMEQLKQFKKIKLLEILDLDEATAEKFLVKYNANEKKVEEKKKQMDEAVQDLENSLKNAASKDEISKKTEKVLQLTQEFQKVIDESLQSMKSILNEVQYAKYVIFEHRFRGEVQKAIIERMKKRGRGNPDDEEPPRKRKW